MARHADIVKNDWSLRQQLRMGWVISNYAWLPNGSYLFTTEFHEDDECPFRDREIVQLGPLTERERPAAKSTDGQ